MAPAETIERKDRSDGTSGRGRDARDDGDDAQDMESQWGRLAIRKVSSLVGVHRGLDAALDV
jgi:hypothetical protein